MKINVRTANIKTKWSVNWVKIEFYSSSDFSVNSSEKVYSELPPKSIGQLPFISVLFELSSEWGKSPQEILFYSLVLWQNEEPISGPLFIIFTSERLYCELLSVCMCMCVPDGIFLSTRLKEIYRKEYFIIVLSAVADAAAFSQFNIYNHSLRCMEKKLQYNQIKIYGERYQIK